MTKLNIETTQAAAFGYDCSVTSHGYTVVMASDDERFKRSTLMVGFAEVYQDRLRVKPFAFDVWVNPNLENYSYPQIAQIIADRCGFGSFSVHDCGVLPEGWHYSFCFENLGFLLNLHSQLGHVGSIRIAVDGFLARHISLRDERRLSTVHGAIAWIVKQDDRCQDAHLAREVA
ncbi:hypothetical protein N836_35775 [Leptolyngbya sp. Heron Island J]|uniref:hypothetical protein n=1 Tax=Leptolyngbya sp. Heron Island J TaxID=1385935 RepID=UPI0003B9EE05|nr:hypothetical protein [Leptolyngbya sp. Heron Island J]ESA37734.1 hypothetical protein N836_35775 [Leptolyngbya sp. Heron Island J]